MSGVEPEGSSAADEAQAAVNKVGEAVAGLANASFDFSQDVAGALLAPLFAALKTGFEQAEQLVNKAGVKSGGISGEEG